MSIETLGKDFFRQNIHFKELESFIHDIELLSLDIFDTLLFRLCAQPTDVFVEVGQVAIQKGLMHSDFSPKAFQQLRILAEKKARNEKKKNYGTMEIKLEEIYKMMPKKIGNLSAIMELEIELEMKVCFVNPDVLSLIVYCKEKGIKIALLSDMYLSSTVIKEILRKNNFPLHLIDALLVSNEHETDKLSSGLFEVLCKKFPYINKNRIIHIGDNIAADIEGAKNFGIHSFFYDVIPQKIESIFEWEKVRFGSVLPQITSLRKLAVHHNREEFWFTLGASVLGPFLTLFSEWVVEVCIREEKTTVLPFMREGRLMAELIKSACDRRGVDLKIEPIYISRQASYLASLKTFNDEELGSLFERNNIKVKDLFRMLHLNHYLELFEEHAEIYLTDSSQVFIEEASSLRSEILHFFKNKQIRDELQLIIECERSLLLEYLEKKSDNKHDFVTVDLGFKGTIQQFVESAYCNGQVECSIIHLLALGSDHTKHLLMSEVDIRGWLGNAGENDQLIKKIMRSPEIIEELILADCGSTIGYKRDGKGEVVPLLGDLDLPHDEQEWKKNCQKGIRHFQTLWSNLVNQKPFLLKELMQQKKSWLSLLLRLIEMPTPDEARKLGMLHHDDNFGSSHYTTICTPQDELVVQNLGSEEFLKRSLYGYHVTGVYWPQGVLTKKNPSFLFQKYLSESEENSYLAIMSNLVYEIKKQGFSSIIMYGAGDVGKAFIEVALLADIRVELVVDKKESLWGEKIKGVSIVSLEDTIEMGPHVYAIASLSFAKEIKADIEARYQNKQVKAVIFMPIL